MSIFFILFYLLLSIGLSLLAGYFILNRSGGGLNRQYIYFGMAIFFIGIGLHSLIALPVVIAERGAGIFRGVLNNSAQDFKLWEMFYFAAAAGIGQETAKFLPIFFELKRTNGQSPAAPFFPLGLNIGLGFSLSEIIFIGITGWQSQTAAGFSYLFMSGFERLGATLFHIATGGLIAFGMEKKRIKFFLLLAVSLHTLLDAFVGFTIKFPIVNDLTEELILFSFSLMLLIGSISFVLKSKTKGMIKE